MCWAVPVKLVEVDGEKGVVEFSGTRRDVGLHFIADPAVGDYVLLHAGFAIQKLDPQEAETTLGLWNEMEELKSDGL